VQINAKTTMATIIPFLVSFRQLFPVYVVIDALDECNSQHLDEILSLFSTLEKSKFKLLISTRPHLQDLSHRLSSIELFTISANETDIQNYILSRLRKERNRNANLEKKCLELAHSVQGMYAHSDILL
jgi:hypothetical protein